MARKKFSSNANVYGRNMLISEYLWIYYWRVYVPSHPDGSEKTIPSRGVHREGGKDPQTQPDGSILEVTCKPHEMFRGRKQVSSHIQVLKAFFQALPTCK